MESKLENPLRLPMPVRFGDRVIVAVEYDTPTQGAIADAKKAAEHSVYRAAKAWIDGGIISLIDSAGGRIEDSKEIRKATYQFTIPDVELLTTAIALTYNEDDKVEGVYECPRCGKRQVAEAYEDYDTRDRVSDLVITCADAPEDEFTVTFKEPVVIRGRSRTKDEEASLEVTSLTLRHPTLVDVINAQGKYGASDDTRQQFAYYVEALQRINGEEASPKEKAQFGMQIFETMRKNNDVKQIGDAVSRYGLDNKVWKTCRSAGGCGKRWQEVINTSSFFASALQRA